MVKHTTIFINLLFWSFLAVAKPTIVYHDNYDISFFGIEKKLHAFDTHKYSKIYTYLKDHNLLSLVNLEKPEAVDDTDLLKVHTQKYLDSLGSSTMIAKIAEVGPLAYVPNYFLRWKLLQPMKLATGGTLLATRCALRDGLAINLSGGYHHAKKESGQGFCFFADIPLAVHKLWEENPNLQVMVIDLDAHQGNGVSSIFHSDPRVTIIDAFNTDIYPKDSQAETHVQFSIRLTLYTADEEYLRKIKEQINRALENNPKPDLIIYNAGSDIFERDPLGQLNISEKGIIERDAFVVQTARDQNIPIAMVLSGGYSQESAGIISKSIENIIRLTNNK